MILEKITKMKDETIFLNSCTELTLRKGSKQGFYIAVWQFDKDCVIIDYDEIDKLIFMLKKLKGGIKKDG